MFLMFVLAMTVAMPTSYAQAQLSKKDTKAIKKSAKKEAKQLKKDGWKVTPGSLPMERQLTESYLLQMEKDEQGLSKNFSGQAMSVGENFDAAYTQAGALAKTDIAGKVETLVMGNVKSHVDNGQLSKKQAASVTETISSSKSTIAQHLGQVIMPVTFYRELDNGNVEVRVMSYYSKVSAEEIVKDELRKSLRSKAAELNLDNDVIEEILDF